jgi:hypothetical protein
MACQGGGTAGASIGPGLAVVVKSIVLACSVPTRVADAGSLSVHPPPCFDQDQRKARPLSNCTDAEDSQDIHRGTTTQAMPAHVAAHTMSHFSLAASQPSGPARSARADARPPSRNVTQNAQCLPISVLAADHD